MVFDLIRKLTSFKIDFELVNAQTDIVVLELAVLNNCYVDVFMILS